MKVLPVRTRSDPAEPGPISAAVDYCGMFLFGLGFGRAIVEIDQGWWHGEQGGEYG